MRSNRRNFWQCIVIACGCLCSGPDIVQAQTGSGVGPPNLVITATSGTISVYAYGVQNATSVVFPTWSDVNGQDDIAWYSGQNLGAGTWRASINLASHPGAGPIHVHVYMSNGGSSVFLGGLEITRQAANWPAPLPGAAPSATWVGPEAITVDATSGMADVYAYGVRNATAVFFPTWSTADGQNDLIWYAATNLGNGTWKASINLASHPGTGPLMIHVYGRNGTSPQTPLGAFNWTRVLPGNLAPSVVSVAPSSGSGTSRTFSLTYSDPNGWQDIAHAEFLINAGFSGANACYVSYDRAYNTLGLADDSGTYWLGFITPGSSASLENSRCRILGSGASTSGSGTNLTVTRRGSGGMDANGGRLCEPERIDWGHIDLDGSLADRPVL
jgi:GBS Bsp-like repeat-containing protein